MCPFHCLLSGLKEDNVVYTFRRLRTIFDYIIIHVLIKISDKDSKQQLHQTMQNLNHYDSLENLDEENEGTYRVELPHPQSVENEEEFVTNSARNLKSDNQDSLDEFPTYQQQRLKHVKPVRRGEGMQFEMTESLQDQLHLSLDRLSQASYEPKEKMKPPNVFSVESNSPEKALTPALSMQSSTPKVSQHSQEEKQGADLGDSIDVHSAATRGKFSSLKDSLSNMPVAAVSRKVVDDSDNDDIHTVVVDDSLNGEQEQASLSEDLYDTERSLFETKAKSGLPETDQYADLRYNPEWREMPSKPEPVPQPDSNPGFVIDFRKAPRLPSTPPHNEPASHDQSNSLMQPSGGGAITVHNTDLSPTRPDSVEGKSSHHIDKQDGPGYRIGRDSPVRLSADPGRLNMMNKLYEEEFARMLQMERQWLQENSSQRNEAEVKSESNQARNVSFQHEFASGRAAAPLHQWEGKPEEMYYSPRITGRDSARQTTSTTNNSAKSLRNKRSLHMVSHAPTPPRAPKSNRDKDYIEMNKIRLGRKSNSASYLEIYSKRNKQLQDEVEQNDRPRPKSDTNKLKQKSETRNASNGAARSPEVAKENGGPMGVEDAWKQQADRLREIKEARSTASKLPQRKTFRELGNTKEVNRPSVDPEQLVATKRYSPRKLPSPRKAPSQYQFDDEAGNLADHPAFSAFHQHQDTTLQRQRLLHDQYLRLSQQRDPSSAVASSYHGSGESQYSDGHMTSAYQQAEGVQSDPRYFYVNGEAAQQRGAFEYGSPARPSPLMQAYKQRFDGTASFERNEPPPPMQLPPKPDNPLSPRNISGDFFPAQTAQQFRAEAAQHYITQPHAYPLRKRVNFGPTAPSPRSPASRIPVPAVVPRAAYKYSVPLPPTNGSGHRRAESYGSEGEGIREVTWSASLEEAPNRKQTLPLLPPILGSTSDLPEEKEDLDVSQASDDGGGSYLQQYEKQKQKAKYKRYTLEDYKNLKRDLNLGGLGPDLITAKEKMGKVDRARKYAEFIRQQHKNNQQHAQRKAESEETSFDDDDDSFRRREAGAGHRFVVQADSDDKKKEQMEKRKRAMEYARQVPRPKTIFQTSQGDQQRAVAQVPLENNGEPLDWDLLKSLQERHEREKALVAQLSSTKMS